MAADTTLYLQLHKLSAAATDKAISSVLSTLWSTRRTGVGSLEKSRIKFLLDLPSTSEPGLVLACLRSLIRRCVHDDCGEEGLRRLFPADLPPELQTSLVLAFLRHKNQWKEELSEEQISRPQARIPCQVQASLPRTYPSFLRPEALTSTTTSTSIRPYEDDSSFSLNRNSAPAQIHDRENGEQQNIGIEGCSH